MAPLEVFLEDKSILTTGTGSVEIPVPGVSMTIYYGGDENGAIALKHPDGERMTDFAMQKVGEEKIMRFEQTLNSPVEKNCSPEVRIKRTLKFKRT